MAVDCCKFEISAANTLAILETELENLLNGDRKSRRTAVDRIYGVCTEIFRRFEENDAAKQVRQKCIELILLPTVKCLQCGDQQEYCREKAAKILHHILSSSTDQKEFVPDWPDFAVYFMPVCVRRLSSTPGMYAPAEKSEEIRLILIQSLNLLIGHRMRDAADELKAHLDDVTTVLATTLRDAFPEIKVESCVGVAHLVSAVPGHFHERSWLVLELLMQCLGHQRTSVRVAAVEAIGVVVLRGNSDCLQDVYHQIARRFFDQAPQVRKAVTCVVGGWINSLPDRHSYCGHLIPLLLIGAMDDLPEIKELALDFWYAAGRNFEEEYKVSLQNRLDYEEIITGGQSLNERRPPLGCRVLVSNNLPHILPAVHNDLRDWQLPTRIKAAQLLHILLFHAEDRMVAQLQKIIDLLLIGCGNEEPTVIAEILKSAKIVGEYLQADIWWKLIQDKMENCDSCLLPHLLVLEALIHGSNTNLTMPIVKQITEFLSQPSICRGLQVELRERVLACVVATLQLDVDCGCVSDLLFVILLTLFALASEDNSEIMDAFLYLGHKLSTKDVPELFMLHADTVLTLLEKSGDEMSDPSSVEWLIFIVFVVQTGEHLVDHFDRVLPFFVAIAKQLNPQNKFSAMQSISQLACTLQQSTKTEHIFVQLLQDCILPILNWHPGATESTLRAAAVTTLWNIFTHFNFPATKFVHFSDDLARLLSQLIDDDNKTTRHMVCRILACWTQRQSYAVIMDNYVQLCMVLLKRLEDVSTEVRIVAVNALGSLLTLWMKSNTYNEDIHRPNMQAIFNALLVYLDDPNVEIQVCTLRALEEIANHKPELLKEFVEEANSHCYNQKMCGKLVEHIAQVKLQ